MKDRISASVTLNEDLYLISKWAYSWKMSFNPDPSKQATEIVFSKKRPDIQLPTLRWIVFVLQTHVTFFENNSFYVHFFPIKVYIF